MRRIASAALGLVAILGLLVGSIGVWARGELFDSERFVEVAGETYADPVVQAGLADFITAQTLALVDADKVVRGALPDRLAPLTPMIVGGLESKLHSQVSALLVSAWAERAVEAAAGQSHIALMRVLSGGDLIGGLSADEGVVTLNLLPLISRVLINVQNLGVLEHIRIPEFTRSGDPEVQIRELSEVLGRQLPADFGQLDVYSSDWVESAQSTVSLAQRVVVLAKQATWLALVVALVGGVGAVLVAKSHLRAAMYLSLGAGVTLVVVRSAVGTLAHEAVNLVENPSAQAAVTGAVTNLTGGLLRLLAVMALVAGAVALSCLVAQRFARRQLAVALGAVALVAVVVVAGVGAVALVTGVALALLASLASAVVLPPNIQSPPELDDH